MDTPVEVVRGSAFTHDGSHAKSLTRFLLRSRPFPPPAPSIFPTGSPARSFARFDLLWNNAIYGFAFYPKFHCYTSAQTLPRRDRRFHLAVPRLPVIASRKTRGEETFANGVIRRRPRCSSHGEQKRYRLLPAANSLKAMI